MSLDDVSELKGTKQNNGKTILGTKAVYYT